MEEYGMGKEHDERPAHGYYKAEEVRAAANGRWVDVLGRLGVNTVLLENRHGPCPGCGGNDRFRWDDKDGAGTWICSQGGGGNLSGDGIALLMHVTGKEWKDCMAMVGDVVLGDEKKHVSSNYRPPEAGVVTRSPKRKETWVPEFSLAALEKVTRGLEEVNERWFEERSPVEVRGVTPGGFIEALYQPGERVLVFRRFTSQGDYLWEVGRGGFKLADQQQVKAVRSKLPTDGGRDGVWFLNNPVDGQWHPVDTAGKWSRRSGNAVTAWRYLLLESDEAPPELWLRLLAMCGLPIAAIYSSGGRSWHALLRVECEDLAEFRLVIRSFKETVPKVGADPAAITPVRLTRLPGCTRGGRMQRLIYLNPSPAAVAVRTMAVRRCVSG